MGMINAGQTVTNAAGTGLDANGNLLPGWKYMTYSNGVGMGTPQQIGAIGNLGQTVTDNAPPAAGTYNPAITAGPQTQAAPSWANAQQVNSPYAQTYKRQISGDFNRSSMGMMPSFFGGMTTNPYGSQSGGMWGGQQQNIGGYGYGNLGFGGYGQQQNYGGALGQQQGGYSAYGGAQNPYGQVVYRRGLLG